MPGRLTGKVAIVTGAAPQSPGIGNGSATAILFAREGAKVMLVNRNRERARELQASIEDEGGDCSAVSADVTRAEEAERIVEATVERYGRLDVLHNNVGTVRPGTVESVHEDVWDDLMRINLKSALLCSRYAIPHMRQAGGGSIINVSTIAAVAGLQKTQGFAAYAASKAALHGLTLSTAANYATDRIRANCIIVGSVWTPFVEQATKGRGPALREQRRLAIPLKVEGSPWDVGWAATYLASDESRWVTGVFLTVDGGQTAIREWTT